MLSYYLEENKEYIAIDSTDCVPKWPTKFVFARPNWPEIKMAIWRASHFPTLPGRNGKLTICVNSVVKSLNAEQPWACIASVTFFGPGKSIWIDKSDLSDYNLTVPLSSLIFSSKVNLHHTSYLKQNEYKLARQRGFACSSICKKRLRFFWFQGSKQIWGGLLIKQATFL